MSINSENSENIVDVLREKLQQGEVYFVYKKKDGSQRAAVGTTNLDLVPQWQWPKDMGAETKDERNDSLVTYYDIEKQSWRSCKTENILEIEGKEVEE